ncbi:MAG TPA: hypothetical protein VHJ17_09500 [Thermomonospora sp.]|nr:hypothetical protein [Thermomonospora sp.]
MPEPHPYDADSEGFDDAGAEADRRYEEEREEKRVRRNAASTKAVAWITAVALAFLLYDSSGALVSAVSDDRPWTAHAVTAGLAALGLAGLLAAGVRAWRRR